MDVGGWLRGLGLDQYEEKFRDNKIDSFELRAALALAKLYHSTGRPADAYAVLTSARSKASRRPRSFLRFGRRGKC